MSRILVDANEINVFHVVGEDLVLMPPETAVRSLPVGKAAQVSVRRSNLPPTIFYSLMILVRTMQ